MQPWMDATWSVSPSTEYLTFLELYLKSLNLVHRCARNQLALIILKLCPANASPIHDTKSWAAPAISHIKVEGAVFHRQPVKWQHTLAHQWKHVLYQDGHFSASMNSKSRRRKVSNEFCVWKDWLWSLPSEEQKILNQIIYFLCRKEARTCSSPSWPDCSKDSPLRGLCILSRRLCWFAERGSSRLPEPMPMWS